MSSDMKYKEIVKYDKEHDVSLDFNADGAADVKDLLDYWLFTEYLSYGSYLKDTEYKNEIAEKYGVDLCIKLTASIIGIVGNKHTYPYYLTHLV